MPAVKRSLVAAALVACLLSASVAAALQLKHSRADTALARGTLLSRAELGSGWTGGAATGRVAPLTCDRFNPSLAGLVETGSAASARVRQSPGGPFLSQTAYVYKTRSQATTVAERVIRPGLIECLAESVTM